MDSLGEAFRATGFAPIQLGGLTVHPMFRAHVHPGDRIRVLFVSSASPRHQGVTARMRVPGIARRQGEGGTLRVNDTEAPAIVLWMDAALPVVQIECVERREDAELWISNRWRGHDGVSHEWLHNFGMVIEDSGAKGVTLRCSDGESEPDFSNLVVRLQLVKGDGTHEPFQRVSTPNVVPSARQRTVAPPKRR